MPKLCLRTCVVGNDLFVDPATGAVFNVPNYRVYVRLHFVPPRAADWRPARTLDRARRFDAVVDTGAALTCIPYEIWKPFEAEIQFLSPGHGTTTVRIAGAELSYQLGRAYLAAGDDYGRWFPPDWAFVRCLGESFDDYSPAALLGLRSPFLTNRRQLRHAGGEPPEWWLEGPRP